MPEDGTTVETGSTEGQAGTGSEGVQTTQTAPDSAEGQSTAADTQGTTRMGTGEDSGETFFDPKELDPALVPAYKNMQRAFTKRMTTLKQDQQKIDAYNAFNADPVGQLQQMASRMGYRLSRADAESMAQENTGNQPWEPQSWDDVMSRAKQEIMQELGPALGQLKDLRKSTIESQLSEIDPTWQQYEPEMMEVLNNHPSMANDPALLYRMSVPPEVLESRATQAALKKLQTKTQGSKTSGQSTTKAKSGGFDTNQPRSFAEAVAAAKQSLAADGIRAPG